MAGGIYSSMNKVRPGAYINFETQQQEALNLGTRGIATMLAELDWGAEDKLIELYATDLANGNSLAKVGLMSTDANALPFNLALQNCEMLKIYRSNIGGVKATKTIGDNLTATAKYAGTFGNKIAILVRQVGSKYNVETYADGYFVDSQKVSTIAELQENDYVVFSGTGTLTEASSTLLTGGTNGTSPEASTAYEKYFDLLRVTRWNTMAVKETTSAILQSVVTFITEMREDEGKYVQAVVSNYDTADYEGIINNVNGVVLNDETSISAADFTAWVAGATAGADIVESITGKVVENATSIVDLLTNEEIIDGLNDGKFILSLNQDGSIKVEKDINSLHTFTADKNYIFSKNRVIRELDEIGSTIESIWETTYLGKVSNTEDGRVLFKSSIIDYLTELQNRGAITDFDSDSVQVIAGNDIDSVIASIAIKPVDSMEFLYMTVNVEQ